MRISLSELFQFVIAVSAKYKIDESHSLGHSMRVFQYADKIAREEAIWTPNPTNFVEQTPIIHAAAILHDTCDKKYRNEQEGLAEISEFLKPRMPEDQVNATVEIIRHMSYSKVKQCGMPDLGKYQAAFNAVREADLLDAYDFDRSLIYHMMHNEKGLKEAYENAILLFETRVLKHEDDGLLTTRYAKREHQTLSQVAIMRMYHWRRVLKYTG
jgi:HD superfamily phosphodiesterase